MAARNMESHRNSLLHVSHVYFVHDNVTMEFYPESLGAVSPVAEWYDSSQRGRVYRRSLFTSLASFSAHCHIVIEVGAVLKPCLREPFEVCEYFLCMDQFRKNSNLYYLELFTAIESTADISRQLNDSSPSSSLHAAIQTSAQIKP